MTSEHNDNTWIVAHRGAMDEAPENTAAAFDKALEYPVDGIELDVQMTKDGELVLFHDEDLSRVAGDHRAIRDLDTNTLRRLDWGGWHSPAFRGEGILTLAELIERYVSKTRLLIEIKSFEADRITGRSLELTSRVLDVIDSRVPSDFTASVLILSFDPDVLLRVHERGGWRPVLNTVTPGDASPADPFYALSAEIATLDRATTERWQGAGKPVMAWGCNTPHEFDRAKDLGCDVIMTDRPRWIFDYLQSQKPRKRRER